MNRDEFLELSAGHALGALSPEDERRYARALAAHPEWSAEAEADAAAAAALADLATPVAPPAGLRESLLERIAGQAPVTEPERAAEPLPRRSRARRAWFALAASLVLVAAAALGTLFAVQHAGTPGPDAMLAAIQQASDARSASAEVAGGGTATAHWSESLGKAVLVTRGLPPLATDRTFELWYVRDGKAVPAGLFAAEDGGSTVSVLEGGVRAGDTIAVTVERAGGSPTGAPTTTPIVAIPTS